MIANCYNCSAAGDICYICNPGYGLTSGTCSSCANPNCIDCSLDPKICNTCLSGYYVDRNSACSLKCTDPNCQMCDTTPDTCVICVSGFSLSNSICITSTVVNCSSPTCV